MGKLLLTLLLGGALVGELASASSEPPLLIDASVAASTPPGDPAS